MRWKRFFLEHNNHWSALQLQCLLTIESKSMNIVNRNIELNNLIELIIYQLKWMLPWKNLQKPDPITILAKCQISTMCIALLE